MKFLIDRNLPASEYLFSNLFETSQLCFYQGRELPEEHLADTEILLIRSVTEINEAVLAKAPKLKFVGTATIGVDHVDIQALAARNIEFASAAGCNAVAVGEYVLCAALAIAQREGFSWRDKRALIVGAGNTGSEAGKRLAALGMHVEYIDPIKQRAGAELPFGDWQSLPSYDLVSCHVPMNMEGPDATWHLLNANRINELQANAVLINASRGAVVDNQGLHQRLKNGPSLHVALDVWEGEPQVIDGLVSLVDIATPHIAGHSIEGKIRGTYRLYTQLHQFFSSTSELIPEAAVLPQTNGDPTLIAHGFSETDINQWVQNVYPILQDDRNFRENGRTTQGFDRLRKEYRLRREMWSQVLICNQSCSIEQQNQLRALGFTVRAA
ncbi:4-phosphoerythronate dehydrogenase [Aliidiomarina iranensis]|uniref:Erythronate-4-phosphate dehydrogenase n=1 Tax=Aliidiomarina iranensis TaxID=1434071 RepID=A0A432VWN7_9GAMM|nr:4-phosphoerythronate dehydrogenase [Aliidiomarina iranensis]RUO21123.1 4-phosphoerythronate dehydrogenase [Aliidiomarina iranensis]